MPGIHSNIRREGPGHHRLTGAGMALALCFVVSGLPVAAQPGAAAQLDTEILRGPLGNWERIAAAGSPETARYALYQVRRRPMLILSWSPVGTPGPVAPTEAQEGEPGPFDGPAGHTGVERALDEGRNTGSIIRWVCPVSNRRFEARLLGDREVETPLEWIDVMRAAVSTVACHGPVRIPSSTPMPLTGIARFDHLKLGLRIPGDWQAGQLDPESSSEAGSIWAVGTESVGMVLLRRRDDRAGDLLEFLRTTVELLPVALAREERTVSVAQESEELLGQEWIASGEFEVRDPYWDWIAGVHRFQIHAFAAGGEQHAILVSWHATQEVRGTPTHLTPSWEGVARLMEQARRAYRP